MIHKKEDAAYVKFFSLLIGPLGRESKIEIYRSNLGLPCIRVFLDGDLTLSSINRQITPLKWDSLFKEIFEKAHIYEWEKEYTGDFSSREYFRLNILFEDEYEDIFIKGDGMFPAYFDELIDILAPYFKGDFQGKNIRRASKACEYF